MEQAVMEEAVMAPMLSFISGFAANQAQLRDPAPWRPEPVAAEAPAVFGGASALAMMQAILDHVHFGVAVIGPSLRLLFANRVALRECERHPALGIARGQLGVAPSRQHADFVRALAAARAGRWTLVRIAHGDERIMLAVLPLWPHAAEADAPALVVFGLRGHARPLAIQFYAQACGLSATETDVLRGLGDGHSPREIALRHHVALSTVRSQIGSIRDKTGARSITDLVRTLGDLPPIMSAALSRV